MSDVRCVLEAGALNGERPGWSVSERKLYWVDMRAPALHAFDPVTGEDDCWEMPSWIGCYAQCESGGLVVTLRTGLYAFDTRSGALRGLAHAPYDSRRFCFNDGRCDRQGRFLAGPMFSPLGASTVAASGPEESPVWRYDGRECWTAVTSPVRISNGLAWSPDGRTLYHADTAKKAVWALDYDPATGEAENPRLFARVLEGAPDAGPDGACVDRDGFYICAVFGAGCLLRFDPNGRLERRIELPARFPTMPALGGEALDTLYVTSASFPIPPAERSAHPDAGGLFAVEAPVPGLPPSLFRSPDPASLP